MSHARMQRASYRHAVRWIAVNDEPRAELEETASLISTCLVADLFGLDQERVAADVHKYRDSCLMLAR